MATAPHAKEIQHTLRNKSLCLVGVATEIERFGKLSCRHCRTDVYDNLLDIAEKLRLYGKELCDLAGEFK
jgi:hypothetical protein